MHADPSTLRYGFIGLGSLGSRLAARLLGAGFALCVHDLDERRAAALIAAGAQWAASPQALAARVDAVITCLPAPAVSEIVLAGPNGILAGLARGGAWIEMSTNDAAAIQRLAAIAAKRGVATLEAPVTGGVHRAESGAITVIVGGDAALFEAHRPALAAMGAQIFHVGALGQASTMKIITNMLAFIHLVAAGEALMLAKLAGLDLAQAYHIIKASSGNSFVHETESQLILNGSYNINFTMDLACKDLGYAAQLGRALDAPLLLADAAAQSFERARAAYGGGAPSTMVVKLLEDATGADLRAPGFPERLHEV